MKQLFSRDKKGQLMSGPIGFGMITIFGLFMIGILIFAFALAGGQMKEATTDPVAIEVINDTISGAQQYSSFSPTLWIMAAIAVLLGIIFGGVAVYFMTR